MSIDFYGHWTKVWEMTYMFGHRVVLFQCEWFNTGSNITFPTETHLLTIDVRSRWYGNDPFVLPSQVQQSNVNVEEYGMCRSLRDETTEIVQITIADSISNTLCRTDIAPDIIPSEVVLQSGRGVYVEAANRDDFICNDDDGDENSNDRSDDKDEFRGHSDSDTDHDIEP
ncbi:hypothetical protein ACSBR1_023716 [Camellia fascicularis]